MFGVVRQWYMEEIFSLFKDIPIFVVSLNIHLSDFYEILGHILLLPNL